MLAGLFSGYRLYKFYSALMFAVVLFGAPIFYPTSVFADECAGVQINAHCGLTNGNTGSGKFCGNDCGVAGNNNTLYTCICTSPGNCHNDPNPKNPPLNCNPCIRYPDSYQPDMCVHPTVAATQPPVSRILPVQEIHAPRTGDNA